MKYCMFFVDMKVVDGILYCLNLNLSMHFRVGSQTRVTFKTKFYLVIVNSFQSLTIFSHKELHFRYCIGLEFNIAT